jgi:asparagine synthase (glutamine-hydrolysing)
MRFRERLLDQLERGDARGQKLADFLRHGRDLHGIAALQRRNFGEAARQSLLSADVPFEPHDELARLPLELARATPFEVVSAWEMRAYMADVLLRDSDVMSMRHSLELRVPFVDRPFIEWLWVQPTKFKQSGRRPKSVLAEAVSDLLPPAVARRRKRGFTLPFPLWMRGPLRPFLEETFAERTVGSSGLFNTAAVQFRWQTFLSRNDSREWSRIWSLAIAINFVNRRTPVPA